MSTEILVTCPHCQQAGFTTRGLKAHHCDKLGGMRLSFRTVTNAIVAACKSTPSPMSKPSKKTASSLVVLDDKTLAPDAQRLGKFQAVVIDQVELIATTERDNTARRLYVGAALTVIKNATEAGKHGNFQAWLKKNVKGAGYTQCTYMMRAARVFFEQAKLGKSELLSLVSGDTSLAIAKTGPGGKIEKAAQKFVGDLTWGELLAKHDIRPTEKPAPKKPEADGDDDTPAATPSPEELYTQSRDELGSYLERGAMLFKTENRLQYLADHPEEIAGVVSGLRTLADEVEAAAKPLLKK